MNVKTVEELARIMRENGLTALDIEENGLSIKLERKAEAVAAAATAAPVKPAEIETESKPAHAPAAEQNGTVVTSPTVGVFYAAASPESEPFAEVGSFVKKGDTLCIIEAMKLMNEIPAECDGTVAEIYAENGQVVEFGQPLFRII